MPVIPAWCGGGVLRQEIQQFKASLGYIVRDCLKKTKQQQMGDQSWALDRELNVIMSKVYSKSPNGCGAGCLPHFLQDFHSKCSTLLFLRWSH
jgi:hypothetical protein